MVKKYKVKGLDCANCAREVEDAVKKYDKVEDASLSFMSETLTVHTKDGFDADAMWALAFKVEPDIRCVDMDTHEVFINEEDVEIEHHHSHSHHGCGGSCKCGGHHKEGHKCSCGHTHEHEHDREHEHEHKCSCGHHHEHHDDDGFEEMTHSSVGAKLSQYERQMKKEKWCDSTQAKYYRYIAVAVISLIVGVVFHAIFPFGYVQSAVFWIGYLLSAGSVLIQAYKRIVKGNLFNEYTLMAVATFAAACLGEYVEAIVVILLYQIGELLQYIATKKSRASIRALLETQDKQVEVKRDDNWISIPVEQVQKDEVIRLKAGSKVPVDGVLLGDADIVMDTSQITGEALPKVLRPSSEVVAGYINSNSVAEIRTTSTYDTSTIAQIVDTIETATEKKSHTEKLTGKFAKIYTPIMFAIAVAVIVYGLITNQITECMYVAAEILIISCPCALVISIPLIYFMGLGAAARNGIVVKGANVLEQVEDINVIALDKTGTLTDGNFTLLAVQVNASAHMTTDELLRIVAHIESCSDHPLAKIIVRDSGCTVDNSLVTDVVEKAGHGVSATFEGKKILAGNAHFLEENNIKFTNTSLEATVIHVAVDNVYMGAIILGDTLKEGASTIIRELTLDHKKECVLLSGDSQRVVSEIARKVGIKEGYGELRPRHKVDKIKELQKEQKLQFVGDGVNDGPALATANVGVAMGKNGTDVAIETADAVLLSDKISSLHILFDLAEYVHQVAKSTIAIIIIAKAAILVLSLLGIGTMWMAIFADVGLLLIALLSAGRINRRFPKIERK